MYLLGGRRSRGHRGEGDDERVENPEAAADEVVAHRRDVLEALRRHKVEARLHVRPEEHLQPERMAPLPQNNLCLTSRSSKTNALQTRVNTSLMIVVGAAQPLQ